MLKVLGISGSLRKSSVNSALLRSARQLAPDGVALTIFGGVGQLPLFNPDLEADLPEPVLALHAAVAQADALLFASPEYAHGVTGAIKNTLDWLVSFEPFAGKRVAVWNAAARAHHADLALRETLQTMDAVIVAPKHRVSLRCRGRCRSTRWWRTRRCRPRYAAACWPSCRRADGILLIHQRKRECTCTNYFPN
ncbi:NAD(P)H-dependent oxidoreductase [Massilia sp. H-1]|nr:NAD(P)H-dependent oxidoreductase [Massilia sp. H-1]